MFSKKFFEYCSLPGRLIFFMQVGHTKGYMQVLVVGPGSMLGTSAIIRITSVGRWSVFGEVIETLNLPKDNAESEEKFDRSEKKCSLSNLEDLCACVGELDACACGHESCGGQNLTEKKGGSLSKNDSWADDPSNINVFGWLLRKRKNHRTKKIEDDKSAQRIMRQESASGSEHMWTAVDRLLLGGMCASFLIILALVLYLASSILSS